MGVRKSRPPPHNLLPTRSVENQPRIISQGFCGKGFLTPSKPTPSSFYRAGAQTPTSTFEKFSRFLSERFSSLWIPKPQFWCPPLRFGSQHRIPKPMFFLVFWVLTAVSGFFARGQIFPKALVLQSPMRSSWALRAESWKWPFGPKVGNGVEHEFPLPALGGPKS